MLQEFFQTTFYYVIYSMACYKRLLDGGFFYSLFISVNGIRGPLGQLTAEIT